MRAGWQGIGQREVVFRGLEQGPGARFSKVPTLFGHVSGDIILFVSSKRRRLEARNFAVTLIFIPFTTYEKTSFTESAGRSSRNGFSGPNGFRDFRETAPGMDARELLLALWSLGARSAYACSSIFMTSFPQKWFLSYEKMKDFPRQNNSQITLSSLCDHVL